MTPLREDVALVLPVPPEHVPEIGILEPGPAVAGPARSASILVDGGLCSVVGSQTGPLEEVWIGSKVVATDVRADVGPAANYVALPSAVRRERIGPHGIALETVVTLPALPLVAIQWQGWERALPEEITLALRPGGPDPRGRVGRSSVAVEMSSEEIVAVGISPPPRRLWTDDTGENDLLVRAHPQGSGSVTLLIAAGSQHSVASAFAAAAHLRGHARRAADPALEVGLVVNSGAAEIDDAVQWARGRLSSALSRTAHGGRSLIGVGWCTLAAIAASDRPAARQGLKLSTSGAEPEAELLVRAYAMAFGGDLRREPVRLPMAGGPEGRRGREAWIASLLQGEPTASAPEARTAAEKELYTGASLFRSNPDVAWTRWRRSLARGLHAGPGGPGTWDPPRDEGPILMPATAGLVLALTHGLLGLSPDAPAGRIRLAPRLPTHLSRFGVTGLATGDATVSLQYERHRTTHCFTLEPTRGAVPLMAIFEPAVAGGVSDVLLDGTSVSLDLHPSQAGTVVPVQFPLDGPRRFEIVAR